MSENPRPFSAETLNTIQLDTSNIKRIATEISSATGVGMSALEIASPVARELNKNQFDYLQWYNPIRNSVVNLQWEMSQETGVPVQVGPSTNESLTQNYDYLQGHPLSNVTSTVEGAFNRLTNPVLNDIGPGKVQIKTAIDLLNDYKNDPRFAYDPLDLLKYDGHVDQLVKDLQDPTNRTSFDLTYKFSGLMGLQATEFYKAYLAGDQLSGEERWNRYSPEEQAQLITTYYTLGRDTMIKKAEEQIVTSGFYAPDLNQSDGGQYLGSGNNIGVLKAALGDGAILS